MAIEKSKVFKASFSLPPSLPNPCTTLLLHSCFGKFCGVAPWLHRSLICMNKVMGIQQRLERRIHVGRVLESDMIMIRSSLFISFLLVFYFLFSLLFSLLKARDMASFLYIIKILFGSQSMNSYEKIETLMVFL